MLILSGFARCVPVDIADREEYVLDLTTGSASSRYCKFKHPWTEKKLCRLLCVWREHCSGSCLKNSFEAFKRMELITWKHSALQLKAFRKLQMCSHVFCHRLTLSCFDSASVTRNQEFHADETAWCSSQQIASTSRLYPAEQHIDSRFSAQDPDLWASFDCNNCAHQGILPGGF